MVETATEIRTEQRHGDVCLARVRLRAQLRALWMKSQASGSEAGQRGAAVSADEIERLLRDPVQTASEERLLSEADPAARDLVEQIRTVDAEFAANPLWNQVRRFSACPISKSICSPPRWRPKSIPACAASTPI